MSIPPPHEHPYASFVHLVKKPARYLGGEFGAQRKDWSGVRARVCLAFPDVYDIGMSHLGFKILYKIFNDDPETLAERCYAPWVDMEAQLRARGLPLLSLETSQPLSAFDVIGFSLQFELTYTNVLTMLDLGGVPLLAADRGEADPLVVAGGPTATHPEPLTPFLDAVVIGDGEARAKEVALLWTQLRDEGVPRAERLRRLAQLEGVYVPCLYATRVEPDTGFEVVAGPLGPDVPFPVKRTLIHDLNAYPFPDDSPVGGPEAIFDRMSIEIARGCTEGCRFCQAGMIYRPVRERDPDVIVETLVSAVKKAGYDEVSLTSLSTADYSCIAPLVKKVVDRLAPERVSLGVSSLRAYGLEENVLDDLQRVRATGVTFAPEAGSQRMRDVVNKNVTEEQLMTTAERVFSRGWASMKLYFMIGLPTEDESDVREIPRVGGRARAVGRRVKKERGMGGAPAVTVSVSTHVPKPHTPFQWCAMDTQQSVQTKQRWLREEARAAGVELRMHDSDTSWLEGVFARGDRSLGPVLLAAWRAGARFDSWQETKKLAVWEQAFRDANVDIAKYLGTIPVNARLPWDHVDVGLEEGFLAREYRKALKSRLSPPCGKAAGDFVHASNLADAKSDTRRLVCYDCGIACDLGAMREERLVFLNKLGAEEPRPTRALPVVSSSTKRTPPGFEQGEPRRYRFAFTKIGASAFLSHLDMIRALPRAFRRLNLPLFYSTGFHPKPDMIFGPALSLGVSSLGEFMDVRITADLDPNAILEALSESAPEGLVFTGGVRLGPNDPNVTKVIDGAIFAIGVPRQVTSLEGLKAQAEVLRRAETVNVERRIEGIGKTINVAGYVRELCVGDPRASEALARAGIVGDLVPMVAELAITPNGAAKVSELMEALSGDAELPYRAVRLALGAYREGRLVSPLELDRVRGKPPVGEMALAQGPF